MSNHLTDAELDELEIHLTREVFAIIGKWAWSSPGWRSDYRPVTEDIVHRLIAEVKELRARRLK